MYEAYDCEKVNIGGSWFGVKVQMALFYFYGCMACNVEGKPGRVAHDGVFFSIQVFLSRRSSCALLRAS